MIEIERTPIDDILEACNNCFPNIEAKIIFSRELHDESGEKVCGMTIMPKIEGEPAEIVISGDIPYHAVLDIIAHEVAHAAEPEDLDHGEKWDKAFATIREEYYRVVGVDIQNDSFEPNIHGEGETHWYACGYCGHPINPGDEICEQCEIKILWKDDENAAGND